MRRVGIRPAASIIELAGGVNAANAFTGFKKVTPEAVVGAEPDAILVSKRAWKRLKGWQGLMAMPEIKLTPAARNRQVIVMENALLTGFGPRIATGIKELADDLAKVVPQDMSRN